MACEERLQGSSPEQVVENSAEAQGGKMTRTAFAMNLPPLREHELGEIFERKRCASVPNERSR
jgi:hypothetical protein